jgi:hypothetical protein
MRIVPRFQGGGQDAKKGNQRLPGKLELAGIGRSSPG